MEERIEPLSEEFKDALVQLGLIRYLSLDTAEIAAVEIDENHVHYNLLCLIKNEQEDIIDHLKNVSEPKALAEVKKLSEKRHRELKKLTKKEQV